MRAVRNSVGRGSSQDYRQQKLALHWRNFARKQESNRITSDPDRPSFVYADTVCNRCVLRCARIISENNTTCQVTMNGPMSGRPNAGIRHKVRDGKGSFGYNAATGEYTDMIEAGILDPTKVLRG